MRAILGEIFVHDPSQPVYTKEALLRLDMKMAFMQRLARHLGLLFIDGEASEGNLCYAFEPGLNPDYISSFTKVDIKRFLERTLTASRYHMGRDAVEFPKSLHLE
ncbi:hypothetical protein [Flagellimonas halotolerans]|uniref:Uncharacterized protein n=1 Tax=Flagellimonas halotolerans TaxID=3112164 RepID=A0ABU6IRB9_9FLAO|nr:MULTISPECIES: hypothetical protein [unclassified Allomuricauda]MEC3965874.1 hypothetical protein [Muricauda sp. SYSU M86414]MEC4265660.1 hypothetical protein [Muricauda sp. SYSU M84420]